MLVIVLKAFVRIHHRAAGGCQRFRQRRPIVVRADEDHRAQRVRRAPCRVRLNIARLDGKLVGDLV